MLIRGRIRLNIPVAVVGGTGSNCQEERLIIVVSRLYIEASLEVH